MKKALILSLTSLITMGYAAPEKKAEIQPEKSESPYKHILSGKAIFRDHKEKGYEYKTFGGSVEYNLYKPFGFNYAISATANGNSKNQLIESENTLCYKFALNEEQAFYPLLATRTCSHNVAKVEDQDFFVNKTTLFGGIGWEGTFEDFIRMRVEASYFKDIHNALLVQETDHFWGKTYSNPHGFKALTSFSFLLTPKFLVDFEGSFAKTFGDIYREVGFSLACKWGF